MWLSSFRAGLDANKPASYDFASEIAFYFATDTGLLYTAKAPATSPFGGSGSATWTAVFNAANVIPANADVAYNATNHTLVLANIPVADPHVVGALYSTAGTVHVSAG